MSVSVDNLCVFSAAHDELLKMYSIEEMKVLRSVHVRMRMILKFFSITTSILKPPLGP